MEVELSYIGIRPNEKLIEEIYHESEVKHTTYKDLALLKEHLPDKAGRSVALNKLIAKPDFTIEVSSENN